MSTQLVPSSCDRSGTRVSLRYADYGYPPASSCMVCGHTLVHIHNELQLRPYLCDSDRQANGIDPSLSDRSTISLQTFQTFYALPAVSPAYTLPETSPIFVNKTHLTQQLTY
jgi:hypothetical protein